MADIDSVFVGIEWNGFAIYREGFLAVWFRDKSKIIALIFRVRPLLRGKDCRHYLFGTDSFLCGSHAGSPNKKAQAS